MSEVILGRTGITVNKNGFGALPIQRITKEQGWPPFCSRPTKEALPFLILPALTQTVKKNWDML